MEYRIFINGHFLKPSRAKIPIQNVGFLFGWGIFETMRSYKGSVYRLSDHIKRLTSSASFLGIPLTLSDKEISQIVYETLKINNLQEAYIKIILSGGTYSGKLSDPSSKSTFVVISKPITSFPESWYKEGISVTFSSIRRNSASPIYQHKTLNFLENIIAKREAEEKGYQEAIFLNNEGYLTEGSVTNIFLVKKGDLFTPSVDCGLLPGITRQVVFEICSHLGILCKERKIKPEEIWDADEIFLTNSIREILPVARINTHQVRDGKPGAITRLLMKEYSYQTNFCKK